MKKIWLYTVFSVLSSISLKSQEIHGKDNVWFLLLTNHRLNENWNLGNEFHMRYDDYLNQKQQLLIRPFVDYSKNQNVVYTAGYTYIETYPYGKYPLPQKKPEHNIWEQVTLKHESGETKFQHRYRWEQRFQGKLVPKNDASGFEVNGYSFSHRFRYRITITQPINEKWFINLFDELWVKSDKNMRGFNYDRNWIYAALGKKLSKKTSLQIAYLLQHAQNNPQLFERHHTLQFTLVVDI